MADHGIVDLKSCEAWLARATLAEPRQACMALTAVLESMQEAPPKEPAYLDIVEALREPAVVALTERAKKFSARPLPLSEPEQEAFDHTVDLWRAMAGAYCGMFATVVDTPQAHPNLRGKEALLAQRGLDCIVDVMICHYRCRREIDNELWEDLHRLYRMAENAGIARETVSVGRKSKSVSSAAEVYARALLLALANPYTLSVRELTWVRRWSAKWAYKVSFKTGGADTYAVDPKGPPTWMQVVPEDMVGFDAIEVRRSIRGRLKKMEAGESAESLGLGSDCVQPDCSRVLLALARAWAEQPPPRQFTRRASPGDAEMSTGFEGIHVALTGRVFKATPQQYSYARRSHQTEELYSYHGAEGAQANPAFDVEHWEMQDESATGFRLRRQGVGERLYQQQLIALRPDGGRQFILCEVRWLMQGIDDSLTIGVSVLPGVAQGVAVRPLATSNQPAQNYSQAFLLPQVGTVAASLIVPIGFFQPNRVIELRIDEDPQRVWLREQLQRGFDYDRVRFEFAV
jgi:cyclic-di-GMP-binding protein